MGKIILLMIFISLTASQVQLYVDSVNGLDPNNCQDNTASLCKDSSPCKTLTCSLEYANITLQNNIAEDLEIILIAPLNPFENNYTLASPNKNISLWLNFQGSFILTGNLNSQPTIETCSKFPVLSLQYFMLESLFINATGGVIFKYINFQILLAYEPITIYNYGFTIDSICIGMNRAYTEKLLPDYQQINDNEEFPKNSPYKNPIYKMIVLESGGVSGSAISKLEYNFSNLMITYNGTDFKFCGGSDNTYMQLDFTQCKYYLSSGIITHRLVSETILPYINFMNLVINCPLKKYVKLFHSDNSLQFLMNGMTTDCFPAFEITTNSVDIRNVTLDNNAYNNQISKNNGMINNGALVFDLITAGSVLIQDLIITNFEMGVCNDFESCYDNTPNEPNSIISINDHNSHTSSSRLLEQETSAKEFYQDSWPLQNMDYKVNWSSFSNIMYTSEDKNINTNNNNIRYEPRTNQQIAPSESIIPPISMPNLSIYSNITRDANTILNPDYTSYKVHRNREWPSLLNSIDPNLSIMFKNITISNNILLINHIDNFFSFIYVNSIESSKTQGYILQDIIYINNTGHNAYQHYGFTLYDAVIYYVNNVTYEYNNISRFAILKTLVRPINISVVITNINISNNNYNLLNDQGSINDPNNFDDPTMGIIDITCNNITLSIALSNITVFNNALNFTIIINIKNTFLSYEFQESYTYLSNVKSINNTLTGSSFLAFTGSNLYFNNITLMNQFLKSSLIFDLSNQENQFNSFVLQNSTFYNISLLQSYLVKKDADLNSAFAFLETQTSIVVLPFWITISNCTFEMIKLMNNSVGIEFTSMPFIFIFNNTFINLNISQASVLIQGNTFVEPVKNILSITKGILYLVDNLKMLGQFTSQIFQSSIQLMANNNIYSDLQLFDQSNQLLNEVFISRIAFNKFDSIFTNLSVIIQFQVCQTNIMLFSMDHNVINNVNISNYLDYFAEFDSISVVGIACNNFVNMSGNGYIIKVSDHANIKIYNNYLLNNSGSSFMTINSNDPIQTIINGNMINNIYSGYAYILLMIQYNKQLISFDDNIFCNAYLRADLNTYQTFNLIYIQVSASNFALGSFAFNNNSFINIQFIKNHALIKQFYNSLIFLSDPDNLLNFQNNLLYNISILYDNNLLAIMTDECHFYNNTLTLVYNYDTIGSLYFLGEFINITQNSFQYNFAYHGYGGAIFIDYDKMDNSSTKVLLVSNNFRNNYALIGSAFYFGGSAITFHAQNNHFYKGVVSTFDKEYGITNTPAVQGTVGFAQATIKSNLIFNSTTLYSSNDINQYAFLNFVDIVSSSSNVSIQISSLYILTNNDSFLAVHITNCSQVKFILSNISINVETINYLPIGLLSTDSGNIEISNFNLSLLNGYTPFIQLLCNFQTNISVSINNSSISNFLVPILKSSYGIIYVSSQGSSYACNQTLNIINTTINKITATKIADWTKDFSAIYVDYPGNVNIMISQSKFMHINSKRGPAINLNNLPISFEVTNTSSALRRVLDGTYSTYNIYASIKSCEFVNNSAYLEGGAIYNTYNNLSITNTKFSNNEAQYRTGAAVFSLDTNSLTQILNTTSNNTFISNMRYSKKYQGMYSDNAPLGSPPILMNLTIVKGLNSYAKITNFTSNNSFLITNVSTHDLGALIMIVGLIDSLGQIFYESHDGDIELNPTLTNLRMIKILTNTSSSSSTDCDFANCYMANTTLILKGIAGTFLPINIIYQSNQNIVPNLVVNSIIRNCMVGEINSSQIQGGDPTQSICTYCPLNSYSLSLNDSSCTECNFGSGAKCLGGDYILVNPGYWRKNNMSNAIYECLNPFACLGNFDSECASGYTGPLCQSCNVSAKFARSGTNECGNCPGKTQQILVASGYMIFIIIYQMYMIRSTLLENIAFYKNGITPEEEKAKTQGQYIRLLTTYTQIISIVLTFQLQYPSFLQQSLSPVASSPTNSIFASTICFLIDIGYNSENVNFYKIGLVSIIPFIKMVIICLIMFTILHTCKKETDSTLRKAYYLTTIFCGILVDQPGLFNNLVTYLTCIQIGNEGPYYLLSDYGIECYSPSYNYFLLLIVVPSILIWGFLIPISLFIIMFKHRKNLSNKLLRLNLGGIYNEYTDNAYYWGIALMVMKLLLMLSTSVLYNDTKTEAMTVFLVLCIYLIAHIYIKPIKKGEIYKAEQMTTASYLITIFFALYYKNNRYVVCEILAIVIMAAANFFMVGFIIYKLIMLNAKSIPCLKKCASSRKAIKEIKNNEENKDEKMDEKKDLKDNERSDEKSNEENFIDVEFPLELTKEWAINKPENNIN